MALIATLGEAVLQGDVFRIILKMPAGLAQPDRGLFIPAAALDPVAAIAAQARPATTNDAQIKTNRALLQPGLSIDVTPLAPDGPHDPTADELAQAAFSAALLAWLVQRGKGQFPGLADPAALAARAAAVSSQYAKGTPTQQALFDNVLTLVRP